MLRCVIPYKDKLLPLRQQTLVMGILNLTPDSFSDGKRSIATDDNLGIVKQMVEDGVDIVDIGGQSTRPGAEFLDAATEMHRILPTIR